MTNKPSSGPPISKDADKRLRGFVSLQAHHGNAAVLGKLAAPFVERILRSKKDTSEAAPKAVACISFWFVGLRVVNEGWAKVGLRDPLIDRLLESPYAITLRRFRNAVAHFQEDFDSPNVRALVRDTTALRWVLDLAHAYSRFFATCNGGSGKQQVVYWAATGEWQVRDERTGF